MDTCIFSLNTQVRKSWETHGIKTKLKLKNYYCRLIPLNENFPEILNLMKFDQVFLKI